MTACGDEYRCTTYMNTGGLRSTCTSNTVKAGVIDVYVNKWLEETETVLAWTVEETPVTSLYKIRNINEAHSALIVAVERYLADKLSLAFTYEEQSDGFRVFEIPSQEVIETMDGIEARDVIHRFRLPGYDSDPVFLQNLLVLQRWVRTPIARKWLVSQGF
jgi:hypothetical protein